MLKAKVKVLLCGGHAATTALAVIQEIKKKYPDWEIHWVGAHKAVEGHEVAPIESTIFPSYSVKIHLIKSGKLQRKFSRWTIPALLRLPLGFVDANKVLNEIKPNLVLSFGGGVSFPVVVLSKLKRIPILIHEQTSAIGLGNKITAPFATKILISRPTSAKYFPAPKTVLTGNPLMGSIFTVKSKKDLGNPPTILVLGGSRGSTVINNAIESSLSILLPTYKINHVVGGVDFDRFKKVKENLSTDLDGNYQIFSVVSPDEIDDLYQSSDIIVSRAGANIVSEIAFSNRPAVFVPIPWSYMNEQYLNAELLSDAKKAIIINQDELSSDLLVNAIKLINNKWTEMVKAKLPEPFLKDKNAADAIVSILASYLL